MGELIAKEFIQSSIIPMSIKKVKPTAKSGYKQGYYKPKYPEKYMGPGSTDTFYIVLAVLVFIFSLMYAFGTLQSLLAATFGRFF